MKGDMSEVFTLYTYSWVGLGLECGGRCVIKVLEVLFILSTVDTCAIGMFLCAVCTLCYCILGVSLSCTCAAFSFFDKLN